MLPCLAKLCVEHLQKGASGWLSLDLSGFSTLVTASCPRWPLPAIAHPWGPLSLCSAAQQFHHLNTRVLSLKSHCSTLQSGFLCPGRTPTDVFPKGSRVDPISQMRLTKTEEWSDFMTKPVGEKLGSGPGSDCSPSPSHHSYQQHDHPVLLRFLKRCDEAGPFAPHRPFTRG